VKLLRDIRDREPRLKPGITYTSLIIFLVVVAVFGVVGEHFASGSYPPTSNCGAKEIDTGAHREGTCMDGKTKIVVVNEHSVLKLESLEAKLVGIHERKTISGPAGSKIARGEFLTFDLAVTNRTDAPAAVAEGQFVLLVGGIYGEDVEVEEGYERRSFLSREREIPPGGTAEGTVTFAVPAKQLAVLRKKGNLDLGNFGVTGADFEPEAIFSEPEYGVIRTSQ
jgi:hypothetical protein